MIIRIFHRIIRRCIDTGRVLALVEIDVEVVRSLRLHVRQFVHLISTTGDRLELVLLSIHEVFGGRSFYVVKRFIILLVIHMYRRLGLIDQVQ